MSIAEIAPIVPPKKVRINKLNSEILLLCLVAFHLSNEKMMKVMRLMIKRKYNIRKSKYKNEYRILIIIV